MENPVLVEAMRGGRVESWHRGAVAVSDVEGRLVLALGDVQRPVYPRSAVKALQALPLVESGAADKFNLSEAEIALACSSHSGEPIHVETARAMLAKCGCDPSMFECGAHWPADQEAGRALAAAGGAPTALHNNCSGKHAGFICVSCAAGIDPAGYVRGHHFAQRRVKAALEEATATKLDERAAGIDGCAIPTYSIPLAALALGFARFGTGDGLTAPLAAAAARIRRACAAHPRFVGGTGRFDTLVAATLGTRAFVKGGAEGVYCGAFPGLGLGVAIKCDDGAGRAGELVMAALIARLAPLSDTERAALSPHIEPVIRNWRGEQVGVLRATSILADAGG
jgi:L-asparaginase II